MQAAGMLPPESPQDNQTMDDRRHTSSMSQDVLSINVKPPGIPAHLVTQRVTHAQQHSREKWEEMKPIIQELYMDQSYSLDIVVGIMAKRHDFYATNKMYKTRFIRWGWRKNRPRNKPDAYAPSVQSRKGARAMPQYTIQHLSAPDILRDQEDPISISRNHVIDVSKLQSWCSSFTKTNPGPSSKDYASMTRYALAEAAFSDIALQLGRGRINGAFRSLNKLFDAMIGNDVYLHPKHHTAFWVLCDGIYNACTLVQDSNFHLLRELLCFLARNALASFQKSASASSHFRVRLIMALVRMSRDNPSVMTQTFRTAYLATAETLEMKLGLSHPVVLITWLDYFRYFNLPVEPARNLVSRYLAALNEVETATGRESDATISFLHTFIIFLFYCVGDEIQARQRLTDLLERITHRVAAQTSPTASSIHFQRAYAFGSLLQGLFILEDHYDLAHCEAVVRHTSKWLKHCGGSDASVHAMMLDMDLSTLITAWRVGKDLRHAPLVYAKPRIENAGVGSPALSTLPSLRDTP
ncbi:Clr5 domain-containing protein [Xylaria bambusicola]|uniref:Clr5 domain-containing protein n=1 Tax=Xylaria bambusicola TaxID=326684 RepID=UPI0020084541|nr:Clr5 domain-containing protein [Xylaria bambusicola]KAI0505135.1 Clr5 domain-containing protein [Xylaria bambusicola]